METLKSIKNFFKELFKMIIVFVLASIIWLFYHAFQLYIRIFKKPTMGTILDKANEANDERLKNRFTGSSTIKKNGTAARDPTVKKSDDTRLKKTEISLLIFLTHEALEGRYDLTGSDLYDIHSALCELQ